MTTVITTTKEQIDTHPCIQTMRQFPNQCADYINNAIQFRIMFDHNITEFREHSHTNLLELLQQAETLAKSLIEAIEQWGTHIPESHEFWMLTHRWLHRIQMIIIDLHYYPTLIGGRDHWLANKEQEIRQGLDLILFSYRMLSPWLAEWKMEDPQIFRLMPESPAKLDQSSNAAV